MKQIDYTKLFKEGSRTYYIVARRSKATGEIFFQTASLARTPTEATMLALKIVSYVSHGWAEANPVEGVFPVTVSLGEKLAIDLPDESTPSNILDFEAKTVVNK